MDCRICFDECLVIAVISNGAGFRHVNFRRGGKQPFLLMVRSIGMHTELYGYQNIEEKENSVRTGEHRFSFHGRCGHPSMLLLLLMTD